jgi:hypothetical protein
MTVSPRFQIPEQHVEPLVVLRDLPDDAFQRLVEALRSEPPVTTRDELEERVRSAVPELSDKAAQVIEVLYSIDLLRASRGSTASEMAAALRDARGLPGDDEERRRLGERLAQSLAIPNLGLVAKAIELFFANERNVQSVRIVSDLRPIFGDDPTMQPVAALVTHVLQIAFWRPTGGPTETLHFALEDDDLRMLEKAVSRAQAKSNTLTEFAEKAGLLRANPRNASDVS